ncbi:MAG TPA: hypothetical protein VMY42_23610 [Thermoguttaceae bacterium]|nr:hypothetical protein [Thermoguttaceae bacterium]
MKRFCTWLSVPLILLTVAATVGAQTEPSASVEHRRRVQQRVREMALAMVTNVLDVQIQQLEENRLTSHPWYGEIRVMRSHVSELVEQEMSEVVARLAELETASDADREAILLDARKSIRSVVARLAAERHSLLHRLKIAEIARQAVRLIEMQTGTQETTESLPAQPDARREALNLATLEDQRDITGLYGEFEKSLVVVSQADWGGPFPDAAQRGLELLAEGEVAEQLDAAADHLQSAQFAAAVSSQEAVIRGLEALLERIERAQGLAGDDRSATAEKIREMIEQQEEVRETSSQPDLDQARFDQLADQQTEIRQNIANFSQEMQNLPDVQRPLENALEAAAKAAENLFEQEQESALAQQDKVLENLEDAVEEALEAAAFEPPGLTAEEYAERIEDLEGAREDLEKVAQEQAEASQAVQEEPAKATQHEEQVEQQLAEVPKDRDLPEPVESSVADAEEAASDAADDTSPETVRTADEAVERAVSEAEVGLADARREQLATEIAELAHAAHALDHAARAERQIAETAAEAAENEGLEAERAGELGEKQDTIGEIARKVAEGVENTAPEAAQTLEQAEQPMQQAGQQLQSAEQTPGESSKPAAAEASKQASEAAEKLAQAAEQVRQELQRAAEEMAQLGGQQLEQVRDVRNDVEQGLAESLEPLAASQAQTSRQAGQLAQQSVPVDPQATSALRNAQRQAEQGAQASQEPQAAQSGIQESMGEAAASLAGREQQIGDELADAMAMAEAGMQPAPEPSSGEPSSPGEQTPGTGQPTGQQPGQTAEASQPGGESGQPGQASQQPSSPGSPMPSSQPGMPMPGGQPLANMPIRQASQMAAQMAGMPGATPGMMPGPGGMPSPVPMPGMPSPMIGAGGVSMGGPPVANLPPMEMGILPALDQLPEGAATPDSAADARPGERKYVEPPWFARLPPDVRSAIRSGARQRFPRGYEERLKRYFESMD